MPDGQARPRIHFPPPVLLLFGWLVAWYLDRVLPFAIDGDGASLVQRVLGGVMVAAGLALSSWGVMTLVDARTAVIPGPARALVTSGPFRLSRNPIYVGLIALYVGIAVWANLAWPILLLPGVVVTLVLLVIAREETYLKNRFPLDYDRYASRVRRWL